MNSCVIDESIGQLWGEVKYQCSGVEKGLVVLCGTALYRRLTYVQKIFTYALVIQSISINREIHFRIVRHKLNLWIYQDFLAV